MDCFDEQFDLPCFGRIQLVALHRVSGQYLSNLGLLSRIYSDRDRRLMLCNSRFEGLNNFSNVF